MSAKKIKESVGAVKKLTYGIGYNSQREHKTNTNGNTTKAYRVWHCMMRRCYNPKDLARSPTYVGCTVASEWHDFQDFADWYENHNFSENYYELDKDLLVAGNKVYSSKTCSLVPSQINSLLLSCASHRGVFPQGVYLDKRSNRFSVMLRTNGDRKFIGMFDCPHEAHQAYVIAKEAYVKEVANKWRGRIDDRVYAALMNWTVNP